MLADQSINWDLVMTEKRHRHTVRVDKSVRVLSTLSDAALASVQIVYQRCMQLGKASTCSDCASRVNSQMHRSAGGKYAAMTLIQGDSWPLYVARSDFPYLFQSKKSACCVFCAGARRSKDRSFVCGDCVGKKELLVRWCTACHGKMGPLYLARMFWQTQKPLKIKATKAEIQVDNSSEVLSDTNVLRSS